ncbi:MAG TPA: HD domain-containing protein [Chloroflexi bacterium]|jgi:uncharacterized protein|nr:HD domain-containing protein [Chloroflexota bacterium]
MIDIETARGYYQDNDSAHGYDHVLRVWRLAERIARSEGADLEIVRAAALLHDIGRAEQLRTGACHATVGARRAREILSGYPAERVERVVEAIARHRYRGERGPETLEGRVLYDADKLDAIGAIGVARAYAIAGVQGQRLWAPVPPEYADRPPHAGKGDLESDEHTPVHEFLFKLARIRERLYTAEGRRIAKERHEFMASFFRRLALEAEGEL